VISAIQLMEQREHYTLLTLGGGGGVTCPVPPEVPARAEKCSVAVSSSSELESWSRKLVEVRAHAIRLAVERIVR
jgi:hypothetical protein